MLIEYLITVPASRGSVGILEGCNTACVICLKSCYAGATPVLIVPIIICTGICYCNGTLFTKADYCIICRLICPKDGYLAGSNACLTAFCSDKNLTLFQACNNTVFYGCDAIVRAAPNDLAAVACFCSQSDSSTLFYGSGGLRNGNVHAIYRYFTSSGSLACLSCNSSSTGLSASNQTVSCYAYNRFIAGRPLYVRAVGCGCCQLKGITHSYIGLFLRNAYCNICSEYRGEVTTGKHSHHHNDCNCQSKQFH